MCARQQLQGQATLCSQAAAYIELDHNHSWSGCSSRDPACSYMNVCVDAMEVGFSSCKCSYCLPTLYSDVN